MLNSKRTYKPYRYLVHLAVWMALIFLYAFPMIRVNWPSSFGMKWVLVREVLYGCINFQLFYLLAFVWLPRPLKERKYLEAAAGALLLIGIFSVIKYAAGYFFFPDQVLLGMIPLIGFPKVYMPFTTYLPATLKTGAGVALLAYGYYLFLQWRNTDPADRLLAVTAAQAHARYERMHTGSRQLLHHLQLLTPVLEDERTREHEGTQAILLLSDLLRYMLYDKALENERVAVKKELVHFEKYVHLRALLIATPHLHLRVTGEEHPGFIAPLLLQQLTEESLQQFKDTTADINITVEVHTHELTLLLTQRDIALAHKIKLYA
ncbi:histidine kinase [Chitinophaga ginsengisegetis]|uniref:hypothetical protein n=1 Tax=Chitinophaga ginsengisegetis TaxID=393003 RepID=UPI00343E6938